MGFVHVLHTLMVFSLAQPQETSIVRKYCIFLTFQTVGVERSPICPSCLSKWEDIRGVIYPVGSYDGRQCANIWHLGSQYDPDKWDLSPDDRAFLQELLIES